MSSRSTLSSSHPPLEFQAERITCFSFLLHCSSFILRKYKERHQARSHLFTHTLAAAAEVSSIREEPDQANHHQHQLDYRSPSKTREIFVNTITSHQRYRYYRTSRSTHHWTSIISCKVLLLNPNELSSLAVNYIVHTRTTSGVNNRGISRI